MLSNIPIYLPIVFVLCLVYSLYIFGKASFWNKKALTIIGIWLIIQSVLAYSGFYLNTDTIPPRIIFLVLPALLFILFLFNYKKGLEFIDQLDLRSLTLLHIVRIPVEFCLLWLFIAGTIPELMTFEGRNFDIIAGITAPIVFYLYFTKKSLSKQGLLIWNIVMLLFLLNIVVNAVLSTQSHIQQFAFEQPNVGILYFPFVWLPTTIVPLVLFSHFVAIRKLIKYK